MRRLPAALALGAISALVATALAFGGVANSRKVSARLTANGVGAKGGFAGIYLESAKGVTLIWTLSFSRLTGAAKAAEIHKGKPGTAGAVVVPLCRPCASGQAGSAILSETVISALGSGGAYVTVRTAKNAGGEIRGPVTVSR